MPDQTSPSWNRHLISFPKAHQILKKATFKLQLAKKKDPVTANYYYQWGTGFFISADGWALTADHNLRRARQKGRQFKAFYKGKELTLKWVEERSSAKADIALLKLDQELPKGLAVDFLTAKYLALEFAAEVRQRHWGGRQVSIFGFPFKGQGQDGWPVDGMVDTASPIIPSAEFTRDGWGASVEKEFERLRIVGTRIVTHKNKSLGGISGAPVFDLDMGVGAVVAVQGAQSVDRFDIHDVRASEIAQLIDEVPDLLQNPETYHLFHPIFPEDGRLPEKGIAALARRRGAPAPVITPVSAKFMPSEVPSGKLTFENKDISRLAQEAALWAGEYARRFTGRLQEVFLGAHWGHGRPSGCALFHMPTADYEPSPPLLAGLVLAYFARAFSDILAYELDLPIEFPKTLFVAAAGFKADDSLVFGEEGWADAFRHITPGSEPFILFSRNQADELQLLPIRHGGLPVDEPEHMVESLLAELVKGIEAVVREDLSKSFEEDLGRLLKNEEDLKQVQSACLSREVRLSRIWAEKESLEKQVDYLRSKIKEVLALKTGQKPLPNPDAILDEFDAFREKLIRECAAEEECDDKAPTVIIVDEDMKENAEACKRLYRRLSKFCHPDSVAQKSTWFIHLKDHKEDLVFLEAMQAFLEPLAQPYRQSKLADTLSELFDYLFRLRDTRAGIGEKIKNLASDVDAYVSEWQKQVDEQIQDAESIRKMKEFDLNLEISRLNRLLGGRVIEKVFKGGSID